MTQRPHYNPYPRPYGVRVLDRAGLETRPTFTHHADRVKWLLDSGFKPDDVLGWTNPEGDGRDVFDISAEALHEPCAPFQAGDKVRTAELDPEAPWTVTGVGVRYEDGTLGYDLVSRNGRKAGPFHETTLKAYT